MNNRLVGMLIASSIMVGCASTDKVVVADSDPAIQKLLAVAEDISYHERRLYEIESARYMEGNADKIGAFDMYFIPQLDQYYQLGDEWSGPLEPLIEKISEMAGLNPPRYLNVKPANDTIVFVNTDRRKLIDILADASNQARNKVKVTLKMREKLIQVEYSPS